MVVGTGIITLRLHGCRSLKEKRKIVKPIIIKLKNKYNVSLSEVGSNDVYTKAEIGFALTGNDRRFINSVIDKLIHYIECSGTAEMLDTDFEIFNF